MLKKAKEFIASADCRTKGMLAAACVYAVMMLSTGTAGAIKQIKNFKPTVDIVVKDGIQDEKEYLVKQDTVKNVLDEISIQLDSKDEVNKELTSLVEDNDFLKITRVETKTETKIEDIPFRTIEKGKGSWTTTVVQQGKKGKAERTYLITYANKEEVSRSIIRERTIEKPIEKIIQHGGIQKGTVFTGRLTTYGGDCKGCSGRSSSGVRLSPTSGVNGSHSPYLKYNGKKYYCLAADRSIPFGTIIKISHHHLSTNSTIYGIVVDRGSAIKGNKVDIFNGSEKGATYFHGGTSNQTRFEIVSMGHGSL